MSVFFRTHDQFDFSAGTGIFVGFKTTQSEHNIFKNTTLACVIIKQTVLSKGWGWTLYIIGFKHVFTENVSCSVMTVNNVVFFVFAHQTSPGALKMCDFSSLFVFSETSDYHVMVLCATRVCQKCSFLHVIYAALI